MFTEESFDVRLRLVSPYLQALNGACHWQKTSPGNSMLIFIWYTNNRPTHGSVVYSTASVCVEWTGLKVAFPNKQKFIAVLTNDTLTLIMSYDMLQATITYICELLIHLLIIYSQSARCIRLRTFFPKKILLECISPVKESDCSEPFISWTLDILNENLDFPNFSSKHRELTHVISKK